jgi:hypothetical protein
VSEYQYYEFAAVDRPPTARERAELRALSTRADITATSFTNTYEWGNFKGNPHKLMERYFDAHMYLANWALANSCFGSRNASAHPRMSQNTASVTAHPHGPPASTSSSTSTERTKTAPTSSTPTDTDCSPR